MGSARVSRAVVVVSTTTLKHQLFFHCLVRKECGWKYSARRPIPHAGGVCSPFQLHRFGLAPQKSGAEAHALQALRELCRLVELRAASGVRALQRRSLEGIYNEATQEPKDRHSSSHPSFTSVPFCKILRKPESFPRGLLSAFKVFSYGNSVKLSFVLTMQALTVGLLAVAGCARPSSNSNVTPRQPLAPAPAAASTLPVSAVSPISKPLTHAAPAPAIVSDPPPPPQIEVLATPPESNYVWIPGHWEHQKHWTWTSGHWTPQPRPRAQWIPGRWARLDRGWMWVEGYWR